MKLLIFLLATIGLSNGQRAASRGLPTESEPSLVYIPPEMNMDTESMMARSFHANTKRKGLVKLVRLAPESNPEQTQSTGPPGGGKDSAQLAKPDPVIDLSDIPFYDELNDDWPENIGGENNANDGKNDGNVNGGGNNNKKENGNGKNNGKNVKNNGKSGSKSGKNDKYNGKNSDKNGKTSNRNDYEDEVSSQSIPRRKHDDDIGDDDAVDDDGEVDDDDDDERYVGRKGSHGGSRFDNRRPFGDAGDEEGDGDSGDSRRGGGGRFGEGRNDSGRKGRRDEGRQESGPDGNYFRREDGYNGRYGNDDLNGWKRPGGRREDNQEAEPSRTHPFWSAFRPRPGKGYSDDNDAREAEYDLDYEEPRPFPPRKAPPKKAPPKAKGPKGQKSPKDPKRPMPLWNGRGDFGRQPPFGPRFPDARPPKQIERLHPDKKGQEDKALAVINIYLPE